LAAQDLSAAGFGDAESAAKMLGKALNDPERGLTALSRAGVTFTQQQKDQIKTLTEGGEVLKAQQLILAEVESQVGGVAAATATGIDQFNVYFDNLKEELGLAVLPLINALISGLLPAIRTVGDMVRDSSKFFQENKNAIIVATVAVTAFTLAMSRQAIVTAATTVALAAQRIAMGLYITTYATATGATTALSAAMRLIPFVAIVTAAAAAVIAINEFNSAANKTAAELDRIRSAQDKFRKSTNNFEDDFVGLNRGFVLTAQSGEKYRGVLSATVTSAVAAGNAIRTGLVPPLDEAAIAAFGAYKEFIKFAQVTAQSTKTTADQAERGLTATVVALDDVTKSTSGATGATTSLTNSLKANREAFRDSFGEASREAIKSTLATLSDGLDKAKERFTSFASTISSGLFGQLNIGSAVDAAAESGGSIVGSFVDQAAGVQAFGDQLQQLLTTNLSEEAFAMVASLSAEKGALLANELLGANSETMIANFNQAVAATKTVAELVGQNSAAKFYQAGVDSAQNTYEGFRDNFKKDGPGYDAMNRIMDRLAASMQRDTTVTVTTINRSVNEVLGNFGGPRALGGPVNPSKSYLVGERGPELFVPNIAGTIVPNGGSAGGAAVSGSMITVNVTAGMGTDGAQVGEQIVSALRAYERRNGALPITVAS
jgi:hypothetical protein